MSLWDRAIAGNPMIAILRGLEPAQAIAVADLLVGVGFRIIEVPLNSPSPLKSIEAIARKHGGGVVVGAGTVLTAEQTSQVVAAGGQIIVSPNMNPIVGEQAIALDAKWCPGVMTPTEAFEALRLGAAMLKLFPAELIPPKAVRAMRAVLPSDAVIAAVGGITPDTMGDYYRAGCNGFGLGSALFKPTYPLDDIKARAKAYVKAFEGLSRS